MLPVKKGLPSRKPFFMAIVKIMAGKPWISQITPPRGSSKRAPTLNFPSPLAGEGAPADTVIARHSPRCNSGLKGTPDLMAPKAAWMSFRIMAPMMSIGGLPAAASRWRNNAPHGVLYKVVMAGM
jgi:hypothetical protein